MKPHVLPSRRSGNTASTRAFTLTETVIASAIFSLLLLVLVSTQVFGLQMYRVAETKLAATADGRRAMNHIRDTIREGKIVVVGQGSASSFTNIADESPQIGNAVQIYPTTNLANYIRFYLDASDTSLKRVTSADTTPTVLAKYVTNNLVFRAEDYAGTVLTNDRNSRVIRVLLEFYQWEYPVATIGDGGLYDYYRLQTRVTRRTIE